MSAAAEWDTQVRRMRPSHASTLGHILNSNQEWKRLMGHIPKDFFTLDTLEKEKKRFDTAQIEIIEMAARDEPYKTAFEILLDEWGTMSSEGKRLPTMAVLLEYLIDIEAIRAASYLSMQVLGDCEITPENAAERRGMMEIRRANEKNVEEDFSVIDVAIEVAGEEEDIDNSDFVHGLPVPPENNLGVHKVPYKYLKRITQDFAAKDAKMFVGRGGFAEVYLGVTERRKVQLAVKRLNKEASSMTASTADQTFNYEVAELSRLKHPNLIKIIGYSNDNRESVCLVYPYFVNGNLEDRILMKRSQHQELMLTSTHVAPLKAKQRMRILTGVAEGIHFLHTQPKPMIHRDIKSPNILIDDDDETPKIADFGLLRHAAKDETMTVNIKGTPAYMAPEAASGDLRTPVDVYCFGVVLLQVVSGLKTHDEGREEKNIIAHVEDLLEDAKSPAEKRSAVDQLTDPNAEWPFAMAERLMADLALSCLKKRPKQRPSAAGVVAKLRQISGAER